MFRQEALDQLASPEQLDALMVVTSRRGWVALTAVLLLLVALVAWGFMGVVPTRVDGEAVFIRTGGLQSVTVTAAGRIRELAITPGDKILEGEVVARLAQPELRAQMQVQQTRVQGLADRLAKLRRHRARQAELQVAFSEQRRTNLEDLLAINNERLGIQRQLESQGLIPRRNRIETAEKIATIKADLKELAVEDSRQEQDWLQRIESAWLELEQARSELEGITARYRQAAEVHSPYSGQVVEVKRNAGVTVTAGSSLFSMERAGADIDLLEAAVFLPAREGKRLTPGMTALISPASVRREEHGYLIGRVVQVSEFPATFEGMMRLLDNESLVRSLMGEGAVFEAEVVLLPDPATPSGYRWTSGEGPGREIHAGELAQARITVAERRPVTLVIPTLRGWLGL